MPHKINLDEYEVSRTNSYIDQSFQKNNLYTNSNNQINISRINININENYNDSEEKKLEIMKMQKIQNQKSKLVIMIIHLWKILNKIMKLKIIKIIEELT